MVKLNYGREKLTKDHKNTRRKKWEQYLDDGRAPLSSRYPLPSNFICLTGWETRFSNICAYIQRYTWKTGGLEGPLLNRPTISRRRREKQITFWLSARAGESLAPLKRFTTPSQRVEKGNKSTIIRRDWEEKRISIDRENPSVQSQRPIAVWPASSAAHSLFFWNSIPCKKPFQKIKY